MKSKLFGIAAALVKGRKYTLALVGAQLVYLAYKYMQERKVKSLRGK
ncbi:hypothetical protein SAMN05421636_11138 [Pricia antarctica]|uniref:Uncharacterized protein n=2 Tax=Pricia antarctica TaxID=641691 RepID=A0A1G7I6W0_9FLAO|nr:hypothetical protein SAMN05421636_11138 [Pricia antarctica]